MKPFEYYSKVDVPYPRPQDYNRVYLYDRGECVWEGPQSEWRPFTLSFLDVHGSTMEQVYPGHVKQVVKNEEGFKEAMKAYNEVRNRLYTEFERDLYEEFGVSDNPKRYKCFQMAWDRGHSEGFHRVYDEFEDLMELIR